jgi:hypothetical protein
MQTCPVGWVEGEGGGGSDGLTNAASLSNLLVLFINLIVASNINLLVSFL